MERVDEIREPVKILLVDDRQDGLIAMEAVLSSPEHILIKASSGEEALAALLLHDFALILLDVQMPGMDGFETATVIKQRDRSKHIPILFVTAISKHSQYVYRGYECGAVDYIFKPFDPVVLRSKVAIFAELHRKNELLRRQTELLRLSEERYRLIVEAARDFITTCDSHGTLTSMSPVFENITGWSPSHFVGRHYSEMIHPEDVGRMAKSLSEVFQNASAFVQARVRTVKGEFVPVEFSAKPMMKDGQITGALGVGRDITERLRGEREQLRRRDLERANEELERFAHVCSHDLQEPLRMVGTFTQLLDRRYRAKLDPGADEILSYIVDGTSRMSQLIRDLLSYSLLGAPQVTLEEVEMSDLVEQVVRSLSLVVQESGASIVAVDLPRIQVNRVQIAQVLQNLIANAIKFRGHGSPKIEISAVQREDDWIFSIRDNGIGFEMDFADKIFHVFKRLHRRDEYPGTGIGLAICKRVIERHGGKIWAESKKGEGTCFRFTLPTGPVSLEPPLPPPGRGAVFHERSGNA